MRSEKGEMEMKWFMAISAAVVVAFAPMAAKAFVCTNCCDKGKVKVQCPVCQGTKYMWKCLSTKFSTGNYDSLTEPGVFCGYGTTYHPLHSNCKSSKARICCPMCISMSGVSSLGFAELDCPMCDGRGNLFSTVYIVKDPDMLSPFMLSESDSDIAAGRTGTSNVIMRRMSSEDIEDYLTVYPKSRVFTGIESLRRYAHLQAIRNGGAMRTIVVNRPRRTPPPGLSAGLDGLSSEKGSNASEDSGRAVDLEKELEKRKASGRSPAR